MTFKTIMSPANAELYPLRVLEVRVAQGEFVKSEQTALLAETRNGQRIAITCATAGRVTHTPREGALLDKRQMLLLIETFEEGAGKQEAEATQDDMREAGAAQDAYASARGQQERVRPLQDTVDTAPPPPETPTLETPGEDAISAAAAGFATPARNSRLRKILVRGTALSVAFLALYALTYADAFNFFGNTLSLQTGASTPAGWMSAPALSRPDTLTYKAKEGAKFYSVDVDSHGRAIVAGRVNSQAIVCAYTFDAGDPDCSAPFRLPSKSSSDEPSNDVSTGTDQPSLKDDPVLAAQMALLGINSVEDRTLPPVLGFVIQGAYTNGDALLGFSPDSFDHDDPTAFYRYDPDSKHLERLKDLAIDGYYFTLARNARHIAVLGSELEGHCSCQALLFLDRSGHSATAYIQRKWAPPGKSMLAYGVHRVLRNVSLAESGNSSWLHLTGSTRDSYGSTQMMLTDIPFEDDGSGVRLVDNAKSETIDTVTLLSDIGADAAPYRGNKASLTARSYDSTTGAMVWSAVLRENLVPKNKMPYGGMPGYNQRLDALLTIETAHGEIYRRILTRGDESAQDGLSITRIVQLTGGRHALLLRESTRRKKHLFSAILIVDADGTPLRQEWSSDVILDDLVLGGDGYLYAAGFIKADDDKRYGMLRRYKVTDF